MWLFDDILKKPVNSTWPTDPLSGTLGNQGWSSQGSGQTQQDNKSSAPIFIQKTSEETVFGAETEARAVAQANAPISTPTVHAEGDTSSILMSNTPTNIAPAAPMIIMTETLPQITEVSANFIATPPIPAVPAPMISINNTPQPITNTQPIIQNSSPVSAPLIMSTNENIPTQAQVLPTQAPMISLAHGDNGSPLVSQLPAENTSSNNSLFDSIISPTSSQSSVAQATPVAVVQTVEEPLAAPQVAPVVESRPATVSATHEFSTPRDFIEKSIANIDVMIVNIDKRHTAKEIEEESYRIEKLRFTELEKNAHTEKIIMDKERGHALHMRKILETELERDANNKLAESNDDNHVVSTLKEIWTEHSIHKHTHKKTEAQHEEEHAAA